MKASVAYKTLDNITVVMLAFNNFKTTLSQEFQQTNQPTDEDKESGMQVGGSVQSDDQQRSTEQPGGNANAFIDNPDSHSGGLVFSANKEVIGVTKDEINRVLNLPNLDLGIDDVEKMLNKPRMPKLSQEITRKPSSTKQQTSR